jgi:four helix bundle protein
MKIASFEEVIAWQKAKLLTLEIYKTFLNNEDKSFIDQIRRASVSIMNNIAEGSGRGSNTEFKNFLIIARGSCQEVRSMIILAKDLNYINLKTFEILNSLAIEIGKILTSLIKYLHTNKNYQTKELQN